jgi:predicted nucleotidyltransferase component of viral defense system
VTGNVDNFAKLKPDERQVYFEETAARRGFSSNAVEKDFWVCWTLNHRFALEAVPELRFKGGTSLSKVFGLIKRFSEDIDNGPKEYTERFDRRCAEAIF